MQRSRDSPPPTPQSWAPPKHPLPPHRLARLANALGVSTPMPAIHTPSPLLSPSYNGSSPVDPYRRSPTPSSASTFGFTPVTSRYLLHVIPPIHLPHDTDSFDSELTPPPSTASGYHTQFRRGTLVPVHSTLQSQLGAIAKEYALPSTAGLILYLVSQPRANHSPPPSEKSFNDEQDEPGPRLSEDIWRHLWTRVVKTELRDEGVSLAPPLLGLGISSLAANRSTPYLNAHAHAYPLPLLSTNSSALQAPFTPSPTTPSSTSEPPHRFHTKSAPPSSSSPSRSPSEAETPDTSQAASSRADSLDLPGLHADALIPILAKVEFDIDRRKAGWYEPWVRSRRMNHAKRERAVGQAHAQQQRKNSAASAVTAESSASAEEDERERKAPLAFRLGKKGKASSLRRYLPLSESPRSMTGESDSDLDAEEEADMRSHAHPVRPGNPHVVQLALSAAELRDDEDAGSNNSNSDSGKDEVHEVLNLMRRPSLSLDIPIPGMQGSPSRRRAPPPTPLVLHSSASTSPPGMPRVVPPSGSEDKPEWERDEDERERDDEGEDDDEEVTLPDQEGWTRLAYLDGDGDGEGGDLLAVPGTGKSERRRGDIYDDMDLGFEVSSDDFDMDDPNDRRKSQVIMRAQLDELEKTMAQFSPRMLRTDLEERGTTFSSPSVSPPLSAFGQRPPRSNADVFPPTPRLPTHPDIHHEEDSDTDDLSQQAAWPAVPYTSLAERPAHSPAPGQQHFPPQLAVNGVSASLPKRFRAGSSSLAASSTASSESELRKRDLLADQPAYPALTPSIGPKSSLNSPLIPLSPDPFGRHPSSVGAPDVPAGGKAMMDKRASASYWEPPVVIPASVPATPVEVQRKSSGASLSKASSSRFSTDSVNGVGASSSSAAGSATQTQKQANRTTIMSVKSIKKLWRKSNKPSVSLTTAPKMEAVHENVWSPLSPPPPPQRPNRPSMEDMELPDVGDVTLPMSMSMAMPPPRTPLTGAFPIPGSPRPGQGLGERRPSTSSQASQDQMRRPSMDQVRRPSMDQMRRPSMSSQSSMDQLRRPSVSSERRPSPDPSQMPMPPPPQPPQLGVPARRPSPEQVVPPSPHVHAHAHQLGVPARRPSDGHMPQMSVSAPAHVGMLSQLNAQPLHPQLSVPPPMLQSNKSAPIIPAKAGPPRQTVTDNLVWDQDSPYPTRVAMPARAPSVSSSASRPSSRPPSPKPSPPPSIPSPPMPESPPNKEHRNSVRKSILKWKSATNGTAVPAPLTPSASGFRTRKTSLTGSPSLGSPLNLPVDNIPPSPKIPEQFISYMGSHPPPPAPAPRPNSAAIVRRRLSAKMASTSTDASSRRQSQHHRPRESMASSSHSHGSEETRDTHESTSLDTSGFEIVSPRMGGTLSFPYNELDQDGVRM